MVVVRLCGCCCTWQGEWKCLLMFLKVALIVIYCNFRCEYTVCCFFFFCFVLFKGRLLIVIWIWSLCFFYFNGQVLLWFLCDYTENWKSTYSVIQLYLGECKQQQQACDDKNTVGFLMLKVQHPANTTFDSRLFKRPKKHSLDMSNQPLRQLYVVDSYQKIYLQSVNAFIPEFSNVPP